MIGRLLPVQGAGRSRSPRHHPRQPQAELQQGPDS